MAERHDVVVVGAGLAGLCAARDLAQARTDVIVLEARDRAGGRVEQTTTTDGRLVQLGGEVVGEFHTAYRDLVGELGLTLVPSFTANSGTVTWVLSGQRLEGDVWPWMSDTDRRSYDAIETQYAKLAATVDPNDPWSHADAEKLDRLSLGDWLRAEGASPSVVRAMELTHLQLGIESVERTSLLADLRKEAWAGAEGFYSYEAWETMRVLEGSATVGLRMAAELGNRVRYSAVVTAITVGPDGCKIVLDSGETLEAASVVSAVPAGPLRNIEITGVSNEKLASLAHQSHALAAKFVAVYEKSFWSADGLDGVSYMEHHLMGGTWSQSEGMLSALIPPERIGAYLATPPHLLDQLLLEQTADAFGSAALNPQEVYRRNWAVDPWTQGYVTAWRPGDVVGVGPLHGKNEPPFYVCGSDQWICGYLEGAVRTGRQAAQEVLARG